MPSVSPRLSRATAIFPPLLVAIAGIAAIAWQWSGSRPFWVDEQMIALNVRDRSFSEVAGPLWLGQSAPLAWLWIQQLVVSLAGTSERALRLLPALFGAATLIAIAFPVRRWLRLDGASAALLALLCGFSLWMSFYPLEMKHYSADAFWGLMVPAAAVWVLSAPSALLRRRALVWWAVAIAAHWTSNGGLFATPGPALVLFAAIWRRAGWREAFVFAGAGLGWLASFAVYYQLSLSHTHHSRFLRDVWRGELPPAGAGVAGAFAWIAARLPSLGADPGGASPALGVLLWIAAAAGFALTPHRLAGAVLVTMPLTAFLLAATGFVPLWGRFALWIVPALYAGVALLANWAMTSARPALATRRWFRLAAAGAGLALALTLAADLTVRGAREMRVGRSPATNHGLHDRNAVDWLLDQRRDGDAILTTRLGWPAIWWYSGARPHDRPEQAEAAGLFEVGHRPLGSACDADQLAQTLAPYTRALVHVGFPDHEEGYGRLLLRHLDALGAIAFYREFGDMGFAAVIDLHTPDAAASTLDLLPLTRPEPSWLAGCIAIQPAHLW